MGIDFGTSNTLVYLSGKGIVLNEPSIVAVDTYTNEIIAMGTEAQKLVGRTPDRVEIVYPMRHGVISNYEYARSMLIEYIKRVAYNPMFNPRVIICMPGEITNVEKRALVESAHAAGARKVCLLEEPLAAAIGGGLQISDAHGCAVVDIGGGTTDMAVLSLNGVATKISIKTAGNTMDEDIIKYMRKAHKLLIGQRTAEEMKNAIGCVKPMPEEKFFRAKGRSLANGLPRYVDVSSNEMIEALMPSVTVITNNIHTLLEKTPPEMICDIYDDGILLTGGGAKLYGLDELVSERAKVKARVADNPLECVARGAGMSLMYLDHLHDERMNSTNPLREE